MGKLNNKVAVITGGNSGIGFATAQAFIAQGAKVIITGRKQDAVNEAVAALGSNATGYVSDQGNLADIDALVEKVKASHGGVDVLFINAGVGFFAPVDQITEEHFDHVVNINYKGALFTFTKFLPLIKEGGNIIFLSSVNAYTGMSNTTVYASSKAALNSIARTAATELAPRGIRVNTVNPGPIETPIFSKAGMPQEAMEGFAEAIKGSVPLKRFGKASEIANLVTFLASDDASFITGSEYTADGGVMLKNIG